MSFYYPPDLSAGSFRTAALVSALLEQFADQIHIDLVTTQPNRYGSFSAEAPAFEQCSQLTIHRIELEPHQSGMVDQSRAFLSYARGALLAINGEKYDLVYATSSRLMTATLGAFVARRRKIPLYLDIRDIFVDTIKDVLSAPLARIVRPFFSLLEGWTIRSASKVNLVSSGFVCYFRARYSEVEYSFFTNGIDDEFIQAQPTDRQESGNEVLKVVYAGNMGEGQGLHTIIPGLARRFEGRLQFSLIGDGGRRRQLAEAVAECQNVQLLAPVEREALIAAYGEADVLFLHLNDYEAFKKVLPSKLFEYGAMGKPIWAGVAGYAADFLHMHIKNAAIFTPCDVQDAAHAFETLDLASEPRQQFVEQFSRDNIMRKMAMDIIAMVIPPTSKRCEK
ncbi:glycosyltransferase family 4 protein [Microvirgula aerodenitrificans]|uniref:glycosyltransferase family 4 protein n=1 Tax=Microvirgula aerodenitrificans TaxID=57480 RepID=UPI002F41C7D3